MRNLKKVKTGDVIDTSIKDRIFIKTCFEPQVEAERSAQRFMAHALQLSDKAWKNMRTKWPELAGFDLVVDNENKCIIVKEQLIK